MIRRLAVIAAGILGAFWLAFPANAQTTPATGDVSGTVNIPATLTMTLSANTFNIGINPGQTANTGTNPFAVTAHVSTNDAGGYAVTETLTNQFTSGTNTIPAIDITPWAYNGGPQAGTWDNSNFANSSTLAVASSSSPANDDQYGLAWQFQIPGSQAAGSYQGDVTVTAIGN